MRLVWSPPWPDEQDVRPYLTAWPAYRGTVGKPLVWRKFRVSFACVALRFHCSRCQTPLAIFGRGLAERADPRAIMYAALHGAAVSFQDDRDAEPGSWEVHKVIVNCGRKHSGKACPGELQLNLAKVAHQLDGMYAVGKHAIAEVRA